MSPAKVPAPIPVSTAPSVEASFLKFSGVGRIDGRTTVRITDGDIERDPLRDAVLYSLFTWRRAGADDAAPAQFGGRQGWCFDPEFGSRLWLLAESKITSATLSAARDYVLEALQWMRDDGLVGTISVVVEASDLGSGVSIAIDLSRPTGTPFRGRFDLLWS